MKRCNTYVSCLTENPGLLLRVPCPIMWETRMPRLRGKDVRNKVAQRAGQLRAACLVGAIEKLWFRPPWLEESAVTLNGLNRGRFLSLVQVD